MKPKRKEKKMLPVRIIANRRIGELKLSSDPDLHAWLPMQDYDTAYEI